MKESGDIMSVSPCEPVLCFQAVSVAIEVQYLYIYNPSAKSRHVCTCASSFSHVPNRSRLTISLEMRTVMKSVLSTRVLSLHRAAERRLISAYMTPETLCVPCPRPISQASTGEIPVAYQR